MILTPLDATLTKGAFVTPLSSTLTSPSRKSIKTRDFNPIRCHTYGGSLRKPCRINTYKRQGVGGGQRFLRGSIWSARAFLGSPIPSGGEGVRVTNQQITSRVLNGGGCTKPL